MNPVSGLYAISSPSDTLFSDVDAALKGGIDVLQYRDKVSRPDLRVSQARALKDLCDHYGVTFIINDDIELALTVDAGGVHLGKDDGDIEVARSQLENKILGVSCYNRLDLSLKAQQSGVDYVAFGRFFPSVTKPNAVQANIELLHEAKQKLDIPIVAIGGITTENAGQLIEAGVDAIAVIHGLFGGGDIETNARNYKQLFDLPLGALAHS
jgi:thiamine-phosphate pyrophosphorylase